MESLSIAEREQEVKLSGSGVHICNVYYTNMQIFKKLMSLSRQVEAYYKALKETNNENLTFDCEPADWDFLHGLLIAVVTKDLQFRSELRKTLFEIVVRHILQLQVLDYMAFWNPFYMKSGITDAQQKIAEAMTNLAIFLSLRANHLSVAFEGAIAMGAPIGLLDFNTTDGNMQQLAVVATTFFSTLMKAISRRILGDERFNKSSMPDPIDPVVFLEPGNNCEALKSSLLQYQSILPFYLVSGKVMTLLHAARAETDRILFGHAAWPTIHFLGFLGDHLNIEDTVLTFILTQLQYFIPCEICGEHFSEYCEAELEAKGSVSGIIAEQVASERLYGYLFKMHNGIKNKHGSYSSTNMDKVAFRHTVGEPIRIALAQVFKSRKRKLGEL